MSDAIGSALVSIIMAIIGVAIIAVLVSKSAQTANVVSAGGTALSNVLGAALSPVTGSTAGNLARTVLGAQ
jgi:PRD1 phage membrane DNA delivery